MRTPPTPLRLRAQCLPAPCLPWRSALLAAALLSGIGALAAGASAQTAGFEKVTTGPVVTTSGESLGFAWADLDGDDDLDLFVANGNGNANDLHYRNDGDGSFTQITTGVLALDGGNTEDAIAGDIDNDGDMDLFVANKGGGNNNLYRNQGGLQGGTEGTFIKAFGEPLVTDGGDSRAAAFGDIDGDGDLDLVVANSSNQNEFLYINRGGAQGGAVGTFDKALVGAVVSDAGNSTDCAFGDVDGDGDLDLLVVNGGTQNDSLFLNSGSGLYTKSTTGPVGIDAKDSRACALGDLDGDDDLDAVVGTFQQNTLIYLNQGGAQAGVEGVFFPVTNGAAVSDASPTNDLALADVDKDGDLDLAVASCCTAGNLLYLNNGAGGQFTLLTTGPLATDAGASNAIGCVDYDGDLDLDVFVANSTSVSAGSVDFLYRQTSTGTYTKITSDPLASDVLKTFETAFADVDGDGDLDAFCANSDQENNALYLNKGGDDGGTEGTFERVLFGALVGDGGDTWGAAWGDKDSDGDLDLATADRAGAPNNNNSLYQNLGGQQGGPEGTFFKETNGPVVGAGGSSRDVAWGDMDGDGDLDLVFANSGFEGNFVYQNRGGAQGQEEGKFAVLVNVIAQAAGDNYGLAWGDRDSDGDLDLFIANRAGNDFLFTNSGGAQGGFEGLFLSDTTDPIANNGGNSFAGAWGDMDGDADLDLFVSNGDTVNFLYANQGGAQGGVLGNFVRVLAGPVATDPAASRQADWGDVEGDGDLDLFVPNISGGTNYLYMNDGSGGFARAESSVVTAGGNSRAGDFADLDRDGDLDLLVSNHGQPKGLFRNETPAGPDPLVDLGHALAGVKGLPILNAVGTLQPTTPIGFQVVNAKNSAQFGFFVGASQIDAPFKGGVLVPAPDFVLLLATDPTGFALLAATWPAGIPSGFQLYFQAWIVDAAGIKGYAATNAIEGTAP
jgi:hypothetical protein